MFTNVFKWEAIGVFVIFILNFFLHEIYDLSNQNPLIAIFSPTNESIWEHMKMAAFAVFFYSIVEYFFIGRSTNNFFLAKGFLLQFVPIMVAITNIGYMAIWGEHMVIIDIVGLLLWIIIGQFISYRLLTFPKNFVFLNAFFLVFSILSLLLYIIFTFAPLNIGIFRDPS